MDTQIETNLILAYRLTDADVATRADYIKRAADCFDFAQVADLAVDGDEFNKEFLDLGQPGCVEELTAELAKRGLGLVDGGTCWWIGNLGTCPWCGQEHGANDCSAACAGPVPLEDVEDDDTAEVCVLCLRAVNGPPTFCCNGRAKLYATLHGDNPIRQCRVCKGIGVLSHGLACNLCSGTGVAGVL